MTPSHWWEKGGNKRWKGTGGESWEELRLEESWNRRNFAY